MFTPPLPLPPEDRHTGIGWDWVLDMLDILSPGQCCWKVGMPVGTGEKDYHLVPSLPICRGNDYKFPQGGLGSQPPIPTTEGIRGQKAGIRLGI